MLEPAVPLATLPGWDAEHVASALPAILRGCERLALAPPDQRLGGTAAIALLGGQAADWGSVCRAARAVPPEDETAARRFLAAQFDAYPIADRSSSTGPFTGYYEPEVEGSRERTHIYQVALLARPADLLDRLGPNSVRQFGRMQDEQFVPYYTRAEIDAGALKRQRLDLLYLKSPVDLFFLQIQGSGRIELPNGHTVRVGYAAGNGRPYTPIGRVLAQKGDLPADDISALSIRGWLQAHPHDARATMELDQSYTFFREQPNLGSEDGPIGTLGVQLTPLRSIAVDPEQIPLGAPLWISTTFPNGSSLQRLVTAQDTGSAIVGVLRADIFFGWGPDAEAQAGAMHAPGRAWLLLPKRGSGQPSAA